jgi:NAD(P)-dependent dehydrogenase (short-subunit alcohol dehydrogenase family)
MPSQQGRTVVITRANTGVGFETAKVFVAGGATVVLASRAPERASRAVQRLENDQPAAQLDTITLDLASLSSVRPRPRSFGPGMAVSTC